MWTVVAPTPSSGSFPEFERNIMAALDQQQAAPRPIRAEVMFTKIEDKVMRGAASAVEAVGCVEEIGTKHWALLLHYPNGMTRVVEGAATSGRLRCYQSWRVTKEFEREPRQSLHLGDQIELTEQRIEDALKAKEIVVEREYSVSSNSCQSMVLRLLRLMKINFPHTLVTAQQEMARLAEKIVMSGTVLGIASSILTSGLL